MHRNHGASPVLHASLHVQKQSRQILPYLPDFYTSALPVRYQRTSTGWTPADASTQPAAPLLLFMERLVETAAEYLCRHRSVGLLRLTLDLTRRRLDIFAEVGAVKVVKGVVAPPTPGTETWRRAVAAVRKAEHVLRGRGWPRRSGDRQPSPPC
jgi:hypothetical protein